MMTTEQSRKLVQDYLQAISRDKSEATLDQYMTDQELKGHVIIFEQGLPNYQLIAKEMIAEGKRVAVRATVEGQHTGDLFGIPATGRNVKVDGIIIYEVADNKIVNHWMQFDTVALMQQIGAMPVAANEH